MATGFLTDTTVCIGCKACEVACKQWNQIPADEIELTGDSYDNTKHLSGTTWRQDAFVDSVKHQSVTRDVLLVAVDDDVLGQFTWRRDLLDVIRRMYIN